MSDRLAYSVKEVSDMLGVNPATVWRWIKKGVLRSVKVCGRVLISKADLDGLLYPPQ